MNDIDFSRVSPELKAKITAVEARKPARLQLQALHDLADISQELLNVVDAMRDHSFATTDGLGAVLVDIRESLVNINAKEFPEQPDYAKPVVEALNKAEKALTKSIKDSIAAIDVAPVIEAPQVNVQPPSVEVDLKGVEKVLKTLPAAFDNAIKLLPKALPPDYAPLLKKMDEMSTQLESIDTGTRMKPQFPSSISVSNLNELAETDLATRIDDTTTVNTTYIGKAAIGSTTGAAVWQIAKLDTSSGLIKTWADGDAAFNNIWDNRASLSYS